MNDWVKICEFDWHVFPFEKLDKVFPIVELFVKLESVIELIHLDILGVVPGISYSRQ